MWRAPLLVAAAVSALACVPTAAADIGIVRVAPNEARPGELVRVTAAGYLGMTHQTLAVVLVLADRAPLPHSCEHGSTMCTPSFLPSALKRKPFTFVGTIKHWRRVGPAGVHQGRATLSFDLPHIARGRYVFGLFCPGCAPGPKGSLIVAERLVLRVRR